jgi:hypothetical protein
MKIGQDRNLKKSQGIADGVRALSLPELATPTSLGPETHSIGVGAFIEQMIMDVDYHLTYPFKVFHP